MSEEVSPTPVAAPVESSAAVAQPEASQGGAVQSSVTGGAAAVPTGAPPVTAADDPWPTVEWNSWDGEVDSLPGQYHSSARGMKTHYEKSYADKAEEIANLRAMYSAMLSEDEDPRVAQLNTEIETMREQHRSREMEYAEIQDRLSTTEDRAVGEYVDRFWKDHEELSSDKKKLKVFSEFLAEENQHGGMWDAYVAAKLMTLSEEALRVAVDAKKDGVSDQYAFKLAKAHAELEEVRAQPTAPSPKEVVAARAKAEAEAKAKAPRAGAKITNGATRSSRPQVAKKSMNDAGSLDEMRLLAARRAFSVHRGGRR